MYVSEMTENKKNISIIIVGIAGATRSGKTSLIRALSNKYDLGVGTLFCQDTYFKGELPIHKKTKYENWECPDALDSAKLEEDIFQARKALEKKIKKTKAYNRPHYIIVEGFLLFQRPTLTALFDKKVFLSVTKQICFERRMRTKAVPVKYFEELLWPHYVKYNKPVINMDDVLIVDGETVAEQVQQTVAAYIEDKTALPSGEELKRLRAMLKTRLKRGLKCSIPTDLRELVSALDELHDS